MYQFIKKSTKGGLSYIAQKYIKGNNKYMKSYDGSKPSICIIYLDVKNLYGWTMIQYFQEVNLNSQNKMNLIRLM